MPRGIIKCVEACIVQVVKSRDILVLCAVARTSTTTAIRRNPQGPTAWHVQTSHNSLSLLSNNERGQRPFNELCDVARPLVEWIHDDPPNIPGSASDNSVSRARTYRQAIHVFSNCKYLSQLWCTGGTRCREGTCEPKNGKKVTAMRYAREVRKK